MFIWFMNDAAYLVGSYEVKYAWNLYLPDNSGSVLKGLEHNVHIEQ